MAERIELKTAVGAKAWRQPLEQAAKQAKSFALEFEDIEPIHRAFAPMAREQKFDVSEMAIVTAIMAFAYGKPLVILPVTLAARFQHHTLIGRAKDRPASPGGLRGHRVAVRAYSQTTGAWVRGILQNDYAYLHSLPRFSYLPEMDERVTEIWTSLLRKGGREGVVRTDIPPDLLYRFIRDSIAMLARWYRPEGRYSQTKIADAWVAMVFDGVVTRKRPAKRR